MKEEIKKNRISPRKQAVNFLVHLLLAVLSLMALAMKRERAGLYLAMLPASVLGLLTPGTLIALCKMPTMRCRMLTQPAMTILFGAMLLASLVGWLLSRRGEK